MGVLGRVGLLGVMAIVLTAAAVADEFMGVQIAPEQHSNDFKRSLYRHWVDADGDRQKTRQEVLIEESLVEVKLGDRDGEQVVVSGIWATPYCGFVTTDPASLDIDHMIPLKEVHESGGYAWDPAKREAYANDLGDPRTLIAVKSGCNRSKGAKDPAEWMPPNRTYWCQYLDDWVAVKRRWGLSMDTAERDAVKRGMAICSDYRVGDALPH